MTIDITALSVSQRRKLKERYRGNLVRPAARRGKPPLDPGLVSRVLNGKATSKRALRAINQQLRTLPQIEQFWRQIGAAA